MIPSLTFACFLFKKKPFAVTCIMTFVHLYILCHMFPFVMLFNCLRILFHIGLGIFVEQMEGEKSLKSLSSDDDVKIIISITPSAQHMFLKWCFEGSNTGHFHFHFEGSNAGHFHFQFYFHFEGSNAGHFHESGTKPSRQVISSTIQIYISEQSIRFFHRIFLSK